MDKKQQVSFYKTVWTFTPKQNAIIFCTEVSNLANVYLSIPKENNYTMPPVNGLQWFTRVC